VHHLHYLQQVVFSKFLQTIGELVHVNLFIEISKSRIELPQYDRLSLTVFSERFFFLPPSSAAPDRLDLTPFSSPGTEPESRRAANRAGFGFLKLYSKMNRVVSYQVHKWKKALDLIMLEIAAN
jgi:hypothetical protein